jgi:hypothetical protein
MGAKIPFFKLACWSGKKLPEGRDPYLCGEASSFHRGDSSHLLRILFSPVGVGDGGGVSLLLGWHPPHPPLQPFYQQRTI